MLYFSYNHSMQSQGGTRHTMEKDLFAPIKGYFEALGYTVDGEVKGIDMYMEKDGEAAAVELKTEFDFRVVQQAALRQKVCDTVFIGTFMPKDMRSRAFNDKLYLLKRLGIGLIVVSERSGAVSLLNRPVVSELSSFQTRNKARKEAISKEFAKRKSKSNTGGVTHTKLVTGYREDALLVLNAVCELGGEAKAVDVRKLSNVEKAAAILRSNVYGWFLHKKQEGTYSLTEAGYDALEEFESILEKLLT